jgi:hypothetical protein
MVEKFADEVARRLLKGAEEYRDNPAAERPIAELIGEVAEEGSDAAAWGVLISQRLRSEPVDEDVAAEVQLLLISAAGDALNLWRKMERARYLVKTDEHSRRHLAAVAHQQANP